VCPVWTRGLDNHGSRLDCGRITDVDQEATGEESVCSSPNAGCAPVSSQPSVEANVLAEQTNINNDPTPFKFYPILRLSFGYKF
jgi:hypothetical protein